MIDLIKEKIKNARLSNNKDYLKILTTLLGEVDLESARKKRDLKDEEIHSIIRKIIKSNNETLEYIPIQSGYIHPLTVENFLLNSFLPIQLSEEEINQLVLDRNILDVIIEKPEGQAIGLVMKEIKSANLSADGLTVKNYVNRIKNGQTC